MHLAVFAALDWVDAAARRASIRGAGAFLVMHQNVGLSARTWEVDRSGISGRTSALADIHNRVGGLVECDRFDDPRARPTTRTVRTAREGFSAILALLARANQHHVHGRRPPRHRHSEGKMRAIFLTLVALRVAGENVDFLPVRRGEYLLIPHPHGRHAPLSPSLGDINHLAFVMPNINRHIIRLPRRMSLD